jgi:hypothetical protein
MDRRLRQVARSIGDTAVHVGDRWLHRAGVAWQVHELFPQITAVSADHRGRGRLDGQAAPADDRPADV